MCNVDFELATYMGILLYSRSASIILRLKYHNVIIGHVIHCVSPWSMTFSI